MNEQIEDKQIKAAIKRAIDVSKDFEEPYRLKAFEIILAHSLSNSFRIGEKIEQTLTIESTPSGVPTLNTNIQNLSKKCDLSIEQLKNVYDFQEKYPILIIPLKGNQSEKQILASRLLLVAYDEVYGQEWLSLTEVLQNHGIGALQHLSENLDRAQNIFLKRGERNTRQYKLVNSAKIASYKIISQIAKGEMIANDSKDIRGGARKDMFSSKIDELIDAGYFKLPNRRKVADVLKALMERGLPTSGKERAVLMSLKRRLGRTITGTKEGEEWVFWTE